MGDTNELKPCTFCGGKGNASERTCDKDSRYNPNDRAYPVVRCSVCFTTVGGKDWSGISTAIEAWNKRATATPPADAALAAPEGLRWVGFDQNKWANQPLPQERKKVLVHVAPKPEEGLPSAVAVGYMRFAAGDKNSPTFTIPGVGGTVVAWADCLPSDFLWPAMLAASKEDGK